MGGAGRIRYFDRWRKNLSKVQYMMKVLKSMDV